MFVDLGLLSAFNIEYDTLCRWLLTVKRNYRNETVQYHNWYHAFNVAQMMFCMLNKANWIDQKFKPVKYTISQFTTLINYCMSIAYCVFKNNRIISII